MAGKPSSQLTSQTISKSMPSNKKKAQESAPKDIICCVCSSTTERGHMVECKCCSSLLSSYPFICPFYVKQTILELNKLCVTLSYVQAGLSDLEEKFNKDLPPAVKSEFRRFRSLYHQIYLKLVLTTFRRYLVLLQFTSVYLCATMARNDYIPFLLRHSQQTR